MDQQRKGRLGRPRQGKGRKQHIDLTLSQDIIDFIDWAKSSAESRSSFVESWLKSYPLYSQWVEKGKANVT